MCDDLHHHKTSTDPSSISRLTSLYRMRCRLPGARYAGSWLGSPLRTRCGVSGILGRGLRLEKAEHAGVRGMGTASGKEKKALTYRTAARTRNRANNR